MAFDAASDDALPAGDWHDPGSERFAFLVHELRNLLNTATLAFDVLKTGNVGVSGVTSAVLHRSLLRASELVSRSLAEVRLDQGLHNREPFLVGKFIDELAPVARTAGHDAFARQAEGHEHGPRGDAVALAAHRVDAELGRRPWRRSGVGATPPVLRTAHGALVVKSK